MNICVIWDEHLCYIRCAFVLTYGRHCVVASRAFEFMFVTVSNILYFAPGVQENPVLILLLRLHLC